MASRAVLDMLDVIMEWEYCEPKLWWPAELSMVLDLRSEVLDASILGEYKFKILGTWCDHWMGRIEESQSEHGREH